MPKGHQQSPQRAARQPLWVSDLVFRRCTWVTCEDARFPPNAVLLWSLCCHPRDLGVVLQNTGRATLLSTSQSVWPEELCSAPPGLLYLTVLSPSPQTLRFLPTLGSSMGGCGTGEHLQPIPGRCLHPASAFSDLPLPDAAIACLLPGGVQVVRSEHNVQEVKP